MGRYPKKRQRACARSIQASNENRENVFAKTAQPARRNLLKTSVSDFLDCVCDHHLSGALSNFAFCRRVLASGRLLRPYAGIAELMEHDLKAQGVPANAIVPLAHRGRNTREEAIADAQEIALHGWKKVLLVTSNYHTRRADYIFARTLPRGTELRVISAPDSEYDPNNWWENRTGLRRFLYETAGYIVCLWELRHSEVQTS